MGKNIIRELHLKAGEFINSRSNNKFNLNSLRQFSKSKTEKIMGICMLLVFGIGAIYLNDGEINVQASKKVKEEPPKYIVAIDPGHGGYDPGKIGINDKLEKDINLAISLKLKEQLEKDNIKVIMTREDDSSLNTEEGGSKKSSDMRNRVNIVNSANPDICISIHQNSYTSKNVKGAQVFYYSKSKEGKEFAELLQNLIKSDVDVNNKRSAKENNNYYVLINVKCPAVIVECGFLSNWDEATALTDDIYQQKIADTIKKAIIEYLSNR